jgi:hypothetical protein
MEKQQLNPERITKPIQLLGAWLVGLLTIDSAFLTAATSMDLNSWQSGVLTVAAILNVPIFIGALFLLQTKFRPELQEDSYYSTYLNNRTNEVMRVPIKDIVNEQLLSRIQQLENKIKYSAASDTDSKLSSLSFGVNVHLTNQDKIESELEKIGISSIRIFGEESNKPSDLKVAIAENQPKEVIDEVLVLAKKLGFEFYGYIERWEQIEEDVLFGSYGEAEGKIEIKILNAAE